MLNFIGFVLPALVDLVNRRIDSKDLRFWISFAICSAIGIAVNFVEANGFSGYQGMTLLEIAETLSKSAMMMFGIAQLSYKVGWEESEIRDQLKLNAKTNKYL